MAKIDLEKLICSLAKRKYFSEEKLQGALKEQDLEYKDGEIVEVQKPKFHEGDWVVRKDGCCFCSGSKTVQIRNIDKGKKVWFETDTWLFEDEIRHWTIEDAKDGDVLRLSCVIGIFKEYIGQEKCICYCSISEDGYFEIPIEDAEDNIYGCTNTTPATKKQRDLLFQKMKEAGYEWDSNKKELKRIHKPLYEVGNIIIYKGHYYYVKEVVKDEERDFYYNLVAIDGGKVSSIGPAGEKNITLLWRQTNIQQNDFAPKATTTNRQVYNRAILIILSDYIEKYPDTRFGQMLYNLGISSVAENNFYIESSKTYQDINTILKEQKNGKNRII